MNDERYVTVQQAADALGVSRATIWRLIGAKQLTAKQDPIDKRAKMIPLSGINKLMRQSAQYAQRAERKGRVIGPKPMVA